MRTPDFYDAQLEPFWSYRQWLAGNMYLGREIFANIAMFFPFGFLLSATMSCRKNVYLVVFIVSFLLSSFIEILQLELMRGLFEYDDIFNNTMGALLGYMAYRLLRKNIKRDLVDRVVYSFGVLIAIIGIEICIKTLLANEALKTNIPRVICFQVDDVRIDGDNLIFTGFAFCNKRSISDFRLILKSTKTGREINADVKYDLQHSDVAKYFNSKNDYTKTGFLASVSGIQTNEEHEIILRLNRVTSFSTDVYITGDNIHYTRESDFIPLDVIGTSLEEIVKNGYLRVYRPDYACYVYQYKGDLYWIVDKTFHFEDNNKTFIQYQLWTTQIENLPQKRLKNKWYWDNIGDYFEKNEITNIINCGKYRVCKRQIPVEYSITSIVTGYYKKNKWIWQSFFRPIYEFDKK